MVPKVICYYFFMLCYTASGFTNLHTSFFIPTSFRWCIEFCFPNQTSLNNVYLSSCPMSITNAPTHTVRKPYSCLKALKYNYVDFFSQNLPTVQVFSIPHCCLSTAFHLCICPSDLSLCLAEFMIVYKNVHVRVGVCQNIYIYIYTCIYTYIHIFNKSCFGS